MADISPGERLPAPDAVYAQGIVMFVNMYLSKCNPRIHLEDFVCERLTQAYVVVSDKQGLDADSSLWDRQSNTLGVVLASCTCKPGRHIPCAQFPKMLEQNIVMHVVNDAQVPASFEGLHFKCLSKWSSSGGLSLCARLLESTRLLTSACSGNRSIIRYAGRATGELKRFLGTAGASPLEDSASVAGEVVTSGCCSGVALTRLPRQLVSDAMAESSEDSLWQDACAWIVNRTAKSTVHESRPGVLGEGVSTPELARLCRMLLKDCVWESIAAGSVVDMIACKHVPVKHVARSTKARRVQERQSVLILNLDYDNIPAFAQASVKYSLVWLIPYRRLEQLLEARSRDIFEAGSLHVVQGQSPDSRRLMISPALPEADVASGCGVGHGGPGATASSTDSSWYICAFLGNMHSYVFLYECFKTAAEKSAVPSDGQETDLFQVLVASLSSGVQARDLDFPALRGWMGYGSSELQEPARDEGILHLLLGAVWDRGPMLAFCRSKLRALWGDDFDFTREQVRILQTMSGRFVLVLCCAGAGKTTLLLCICLWVLKQHAEGSRRCVHYMSETKEMVLDFLALLRRAWGSDEGIVPVGFHEHVAKDMLEDDVRRKLIRQNIDVCVTAKTLEGCLDYMMALLDLFRRASVHQSESYRLIIRTLCAVHHSFLHRSYYTEVRRKQDEMLLDTCILGSSVSYAHKLAGGGSNWSRGLRQLNTVVGLFDELQSLGTLEVAGGCSLYQSCVGAGDEAQECNVPLGVAGPLRRRSSMAWARRSGSVQCLSNRESLRYGQPLLGHLQALFPYMADVTTARQRPTTLLPLFFTYTQQLCGLNSDGEVTRDEFVFAVLLLLLSLEIVLASLGPRRTILVVGYLAAVLRDLTEFLRFALPSMCQQWRELLRLCQTDGATYTYYDELVQAGLLRLVGPFKCRGMTADVVFLLALKRRVGDEQYQGLMTDSNLLGIHYTRARDRLYVLAHDLTDGIALPKAGAMYRRGLSLGLAPNQATNTCTDAEARRQLFYAQLKGLAKSIWSEEFRVGRLLLGCISPSLSGYCLDCENPLPFMWSNIFPLMLTYEHRALVAPHTASALFEMSQWRAKMRAVCEYVTSMRGWWPDSFKERQASWGMQIFQDFEHLRAELKRPSCVATFIQDTRPSERTQRYWTQAQLASSGVVEEEDRPEDDFVLSFWPGLMLGISTVMIESSQDCLICLPYLDDFREWCLEEFATTADCDCISDRGSPVWLARMLARLAVDKFRDMGFQAKWIQQGWTFESGPMQRNHKEQTYGIGTEAVYVKQCSGVRAYYAFEATREEETIELMHLYVPMGLSRQHRCQGSLLGRMRSHELGACLLAVASSKLAVRYMAENCTCTVPPESRKRGTPESIMARWSALLEDLNVTTVPSLKIVGACGTGEAGFARVCQIVQDSEISDMQTHLDLVVGVLHSSPSAAPQSFCVGVEPTLEYLHESTWRVMRPPALLGAERALWSGRLLVGSISAVLSHAWLRWCGVTHALGALGKYDVSGNVVPEYEAARATRYTDIYYANWPIRNKRERKRYCAVFDAMDKVLASSDGCLLVYCRNGRDRSAFICYAYLRLRHEVGHETALAVLSSRCDRYDNPLFRFERQDAECREWLEWHPHPLLPWKWRWSHTG